MRTPDLAAESQLKLRGERSSEVPRHPRLLAPGPPLMGKPGFGQNDLSSFLAQRMGPRKLERFGYVEKANLTLENHIPALHESGRWRVR